jgi:propanol-preferring alcohol dehydrogenase
MALERVSSLTENPKPLVMMDLAVPEPEEGEILIKVSTCGVCHTELDEIEGRTPPSHFPMILGHQVIGRVEKLGKNVTNRQLGERMGVAWINSACGECQWCLAGEENLCPDFMATGRDAPGGYAEYMTVPARFVYPIPDVFTDMEAAPHLCAGAIGYRSLRLTGLQDGQNLGLVGFGASGHLVLKLVRYQYPEAQVFVFTRSDGEQEFGRELGAVWAGGIEDKTPELMHSIIDTTPVWKPVIEALKKLAPGGRLVINAIRKEDVDKDYLLKLNYPEHLWMEKEIKSVANVARKDVVEFLDIAARIPIKPEVQEFRLEDANQALMELRTRKIRGGKVLNIAEQKDW